MGLHNNNNNFIARKDKNFDQARSDEMCLYHFNPMLARQFYIQSYADIFKAN